MDAISMASDVMSMLHPYLEMIANKAADSFGERAPDLAGKLYEYLSLKVKGKATASKALEDLSTQPTDQSLQEDLRRQIQTMLENDPAFADGMKQLLHEIAQRPESHIEMKTTTFGTGNTVVAGHNSTITVR